MDAMRRTGSVSRRGTRISTLSLLGGLTPPTPAETVEEACPIAWDKREVRMHMMMGAVRDWLWVVRRNGGREGGGDVAQLLPGTTQLYIWTS
jgi:hypothetical protein